MPQSGGYARGWEMEYGGWEMEYGRWKMEDGGWKMEDGGWKMEDGMGNATKWWLRQRMEFR